MSNVPTRATIVRWSTDRYQKNAAHETRYSQLDEVADARGPMCPANGVRKDRYNVLRKSSLIQPWKNTVSIKSFREVIVAICVEHPILCVLLAMGA